MSPRVGGSSGCLTAPGGRPHAARGALGQVCVLLTRSSRPTAQPGVWAPACAHRDAASGAQGVPSDGCSWGPRPLLAAALLRWEGPSTAELPAPSPPSPPPRVPQAGPDIYSGWRLADAGGGARVGGKLRACAAHEDTSKPRAHPAPTAQGGVHSPAGFAPRPPGPVPLAAAGRLGGPVRESADICPESSRVTEAN